MNSLVQTLYLLLQPGGVIAGPRRGNTCSNTVIWQIPRKKRNPCPSGYGLASLRHAVYFNSSSFLKGRSLSLSRLTHFTNHKAPETSTKFVLSRAEVALAPVHIYGTLTAAWLWPCLQNVSLRGIMKLIGPSGNSVLLGKFISTPFSHFFSFSIHCEKFLMGLDDVTVVVTQWVQLRPGLSLFCHSSSFLLYFPLQVFLRFFYLLFFKCKESQVD